VSADEIKVLVSDDGGITFRFLEFNVPGAIDKFGFPNVTPGTTADCGQNSGGIRNVLHAGANLGGGRLGLPRYRFATRLVTQPSARAAAGKLAIAVNSSSSAVFGDPASRSMIRLLVSPDGGSTFSVSTLVAATTADPQHVHPALSLNDGGEQITVAYFVQQADEKIRVDMARATSAGVNLAEVQQLSSVAFDLTPSNNPLPIAGNPFFTTNFDRTIRPCYDLGEYMSTTRSRGLVLAAWGDNRNSWTSPAGSPAAGTHSQPDVFFGRFKGQ
jgi:hypothetical protein